MKSTRDIFWKKLKLQCHKWENYFDIYDKIFLPYLDKHPKVLEVGCAHGGGLELLINLFDAKLDLYAVDINKDFLGYKFDDIEVKYSCVDQGSDEHWSAYLSDGKTFDIIIDDGSHVMNDQITTLLTLFPKLNEGGMYIIEDTHTSYWKGYDGGLHKEGTLIEFCKKLIDLIHAPHINETPPPELARIFKNLKSIEFYNSIIVLKKEYVEFPNKPAHNEEGWNPNFKWG